MGNDIQIFLRIRDMASAGLAMVEGRIQRFAVNAGKSFKQLASIPHLIAGAMLFQLGKGFLDAAEKVEIWRHQLESATGSAKEANVALAAIREFGRQSPLDTEDVIKSYVRLRAVGIEPTMKQLKTLSGVGAMFISEPGQQLSRITDAFIGMNKKTLRSLGIEIDRTGKQAIISSGHMRIETTKDAASIREGLLRVWEERFPNAIEKASETFSAKKEAIQSNIFELKAHIGEVFINALGGTVDSMNQKFEMVFKSLPKIAFGITIMISAVRILWDALRLVIEFLITGFAQIWLTAKTVFESIWGLVKAVNDALWGMGKTIVQIASGDFDFSKIKANFSKVWADIKEIGEKATNNLATSGVFGDVFTKMAGQELRGMVRAGQAVANAISNLKKPVVAPVWKDPKDPFLGGGAEDEGADSLKSKKAENALAIKEKKDQIEAIKERINADKAYSELIVANILNQYDRERSALTAKQTEEMAQVQAWYDAGIINKERFEAQKTQIELKYADERVRIAEEEDQMKLESAATLSGGLAALAASLAEKHKEWAKTAKGLAYADAVINTWGAANKALNSGPPPWNFISMAGVIAAGLANAVKIEAQSFWSGTRDAPGGMAYVHKDEMINLPRHSQVYTAYQTRKMMGGGQNVTIAPVFNGPVDKSTAPGIMNKLDEIAQSVKRAVRGGYLTRADLGMAA